MNNKKNESIAAIFYEYVNTSEYEEAYRLNSSELELGRDQLQSKIEALTTKEAADGIVNEACSIEADAEKLGFILGFQYAFKLASETFSKRMEG